MESSKADGGSFVKYIPVCVDEAKKKDTKYERAFVNLSFCIALL